MTYAKIEDGVVVNILEIQSMNTDEFTDCVPVDDRPVQIGDAYVDGVFTRDGEPVKNLMEKLADTDASRQEALMALNILMEGM